MVFFILRNMANFQFPRYTFLQLGEVVVSEFDTIIQADKIVAKESCTFSGAIRIDREHTQHLFGGLSCGVGHQLEVDAIRLNVIEKATLMGIFAQRVHLNIRPLVVLFALLCQQCEEIGWFGEKALPIWLIIGKGISPEIMLKHHIMHPLIMLSLFLILISAVFSTRNCHKDAANNKYMC